jgi:hypothetical protein
MALDGTNANLPRESDEWVRSLERAILDLRNQNRELIGLLAAAGLR